MEGRGSGVPGTCRRSSYRVLGEDGGGGRLLSYRGKYFRVVEPPEEKLVARLRPLPLHVGVLAQLVAQEHVLVL